MVSSPSTLIETFYVVGIILVPAIGGYAAYWSLAIRQALRVPLYRRQLIWVGSTSLYWMFIIVTFYLTGPKPFIPSVLASSSFFSAVNGVSFVFLPAILLAWADSSIQLARRSDPLLRDPFRWNRTRILLWVIVAFGVVVIAVIGLTPPYPRISVQNISSILGYSLGFSLQYVVLAVAAVVLLVGARRSGDENFRRSLRWYGLGVLVLGTFAVAALATFVTATGNPLADTPVNFAWGLSQNIIYPLLAFMIYKCARSLVPLNRISLTTSD